jgi:phosphoglycerol transferase MdoB-like AlkP superfamily enzyme
MNDFFRPLKRLAFQFLFLLICFFVSRTIFTLFQIHSFEGLHVLGFLKLAFYALRFDISAICTINALYGLLLLLSHFTANQSWWQRLLQIWFVLSNCIAFLFEISDWAYFPYTHKRATADVLNMILRKGDFLVLLPRFFIDYWYIPLASILFIVSFNAINRRICKQTPLAVSSFKVFPYVFRIIGFAGLALLAIRGGTQLIPIGIRNAVGVSESKYAPIVLNTPFSIITTFANDELVLEHYFDEHSLKQYINTTKRFPHPTFKKMNVVVLLLESFSKEFTGIGGLQKSYTPFLDSLMQHAYVCTNAYANCLHSAEGIPAVLAGIPALQEEPFTTSSYGANRITSIPNLLAEEGYSTAFYHGGNNGTMSFDLFAANAGFQHYLGRDEYANEKDYDGNWGIWDEPFLQFALKDMSQNVAQPFCAAIFTVSSHFPYNVPKIYEGKFPKGPLPIHEPVGYTDYALSKFFEQAQKQEWYQHTLFVLVPDHCAPLSNDDYYKTRMGNYAIPIIYFAPGDSVLKGKHDQLTQQIDILPSVMDYLGYNKPFFALGNSVFDTTAQRFYVEYFSGAYTWANKDYLLNCLGKKPRGLYQWQQDKFCQHNLLGQSTQLSTDLMNHLLAMRQVYSQVMIKNQMSLK